MRKEMKVSIENDNVEWVNKLKKVDENFSDSLNYIIYLSKCVNIKSLEELQAKAKKYDEMMINYDKFERKYDELLRNKLVKTCETCKFCDYGCTSKECNPCNNFDMWEEEIK